MANTEDKGQTTSHDATELLSVKPFGNIGSDRSTEETKKVVDKLKNKKGQGGLIAKGSTQKSGETANVGEVSKAIGNFVNR